MIRPVPPNSTAVGIPAKTIIKGMSDDLNKIPDIQYQLFNYLQKRLELLESVAPKNIEFIESRKKLETLYQEFLKAKV